MTTTPVSSSPTTSAPAPPRVYAEPHRWALRFWARAFRRFGRWLFITRHVRRFCRPLSLEGLENFERLNGRSAIIVANHTSHFDTAIALYVLPGRVYNRTAVVAAADRFYTRRLKSAWYSLRYNAFPITRGGGRAALSYSEWLLQNGWSLLIFPEGTRSKTGDLLPFHPGPAILALGQRVPVVPIYMEGASNILPPKTRRSRPAAVKVRIGEPIEFADGTTIPEANRRMEDAVRALSEKQPIEPLVNTIEMALAQERETAGVR
jgi:1-acyl-sn-glycerol-3-phosphate acyltransferase